MRYSNYKTLSEINVTNLVDVTLVLLIIFMITAPLLRDEIDVQLPSIDANISSAQEGIMVSLKKDGQVFINQTRIEPDDLAERVSYESQAKPSAQIMIKADESVEYGKVISLMGELVKVGIKNVGLIVDVKKHK